MSGKEESQVVGKKCILCTQVFVSQEELQEHFRNHGKEKSLKKKCQKPAVIDASSAVECDVCLQQFPNNTAAIQHKFRKHPEVNSQNPCPKCGKQFTLKSLLEKHLISHSQDDTTEEYFECKSCSAKFDNRGALNYHDKTAHQRVKKLFQPIQTAPPSKKIRMNNAGDVQSVYFCHLCGSEYIVKYNLQKHLEDFHTDEERQATPTELIKCTACDALFYNRKAYENHNIGHKPYDLYVTDEEQRLKMVSRIDQDFDARRVTPAVDKYIPKYRPRRANVYLRKAEKRKLGGTNSYEEDLSPPSSPDVSDNETETPTYT